MFRSLTNSFMCWSIESLSIFVLSKKASFGLQPDLIIPGGKLNIEIFQKLSCQASRNGYWIGMLGQIMWESTVFWQWRVFCGWLILTTCLCFCMSLETRAIKYMQFLFVLNQNRTTDYISSQLCYNFYSQWLLMFWPFYKPQFELCYYISY